MNEISHLKAEPVCEMLTPDIRDGLSLLLFYPYPFIREDALSHPWYSIRDLPSNKYSCRSSEAASFWYLVADLNICSIRLSSSKRLPAIRIHGAFESQFLMHRALLIPAARSLVLLALCRLANKGVGVLLEYCGWQIMRLAFVLLQIVLG